MTDQKDKLLTIIVPAFNEADAIGKTLEDIQKAKFDFVKDVIVVDDGSTDDTLKIIREFNAQVIHHSRRLGYGASLKSGIKHANTEFVLFMDADGQHLAKDVFFLWEKHFENDMVIGQRVSLFHSPIWRMPGKWFLWSLANYLTQQKILDLNSGFRLMRRDTALKYLHICPSGFSFSTTMTMALLTQGYPVAYAPIEINKRIGKSTVTVSTGLNTIILILRLASLFNPLRVFLPLSIFMGIFGVVYAIPYALASRGISVGAMLVIVTSILIFILGLLCDQMSQLRLERYE